jgi:hypothetical protein
MRAFELNNLLECIKIDYVIKLVNAFQNEMNYENEINNYL